MQQVKPLLKIAILILCQNKKKGKYSDVKPPDEMTFYVQTQNAILNSGLGWRILKKKSILRERLMRNYFFHCCKMRIIFLNCNNYNKLLIINK